MGTWTTILFVLLAVVIIYWLISFVRRNPSTLSGKNLSKSFTTIGYLTLLLMAFIALLVYFLKH